jgi:putative ubiquitin-RnfH superfamily antitoxin RatB of RatAB toxin-antitoxin module
MAVDGITIEVAFATPERQAVIAVTMPVDSTVIQAIETSGILQQFPEIDLTSGKIGIFGQVCQASKTLTDGDRVEIYRPLQQDPMAARRGRLRR